jgi:WD40 repeat protein
MRAPFLSLLLLVACAGTTFAQPTGVSLGAPACRPPSPAKIVQHTEIAHSDNHPVASLHFVQASNTLVIADVLGRTACVWDITARRPRTVLRGEQIYTFVLSPAGDRAAAGCDRNTIQIWDTKTWKRVARLKGEMGLITDLRYTPDGKYLASISDDNTVRLWDIAKQKECAVLQKGVEPSGVGIAPRGKVLVVTNCDGSVRAWDWETHKPLYHFSVGRKSVGPPWFDPTGIVMAFSGENRRFTQVRRPATGKLVAELSSDRTRCAVAQITSSEQMVVYRNRLLTVWDYKRKKELRTFRGHDAFIDDTALSPDGKVLTSGDEHGVLKLWDYATGEELASIKAHEKEVFRIAYSADGRLLATGDFHGTVILWDVSAFRRKADERP